MTSNRPEIDPPAPSDVLSSGTKALGGMEVPPEPPMAKRADSAEILKTIDGLIEQVGGRAGSPHARYVRDLLVNGLKLLPDGRDTGELKLITAAVKELRHAYRVFAQYPNVHKVTIFGSARTPKDHPDYVKAVEFGKLMADVGWMAITGAGGGIMEAGHEGPGREKSFGVAIRLPFETTANQVIAGDSKLIVFRYFFTRKLMFISQAEAVALFPGGFGTMDEAFEALTLVQTGKAAMLPIVLLQGEGVTYWDEFDQFIRNDLLKRGWISADDLSLYKICKTSQEAVDHIGRFYRNYHSTRYVRDDMVIRLQRRISERDVADLSVRFEKLIKPGTGPMRLAGPFDVEEDHRELPRLVFTHTRHHYGTVRKLIDAINECEPA